jgi:hypothetical protein
MKMTDYPNRYNPKWYWNHVLADLFIFHYSLNKIKNCSRFIKSVSWPCPRRLLVTQIEGVAEWAKPDPRNCQYPMRPGPEASAGVKQKVFSNR